MKSNGPAPRNRRTQAQAEPVRSYRKTTVQVRVAKKTNVPYRVRQKRAREATWRWLVAVFVVEAVAAVLTSPGLHIRQLEIKGAQELTIEEQSTLRAALVLPTGTNFLKAPAGALEADIERLPFIESVAVRKRLPGTLVATLMPRQPVAIVEAANGAWEVDREAHPIRPAGANRRIGVIRYQAPVSLATGVRIRSEAVRESVRLLADDRLRRLLQLSKIEIDQNEDMCLNVGNKLRLILGLVEDLSKKLDKIQQILGQEPTIGDRVASIDLRCPDTMACTLRVASTSNTESALSNVAPDVVP